MNDFDLGWLVGILEGEGAFVASPDKRRPSTVAVKIQVEMTDKDMIERLHSLLPHGRVWESNYPSKRKAFPNAKDSWRWAISRKDTVKELTTLIYPHMSTRRQAQLDKVLLYCSYKKEKSN